MRGKVYDLFFRALKDCEKEEKDRCGKEKIWWKKIIYGEKYVKKTIYNGGFTYFSRVKANF